MKQEEKDLLVKDLCARLPYGVKLETLEGPQELDIKWLSINMCNIASPYLPYLFPMSSMTEEQKKEFKDNFVTYHPYITGGWCNIEFRDKFYAPIKLIDWLNANHFDYRGLIEKRLAIDCTNLNIY